MDDFLDGILEESLPEVVDVVVVIIASSSLLFSSVVVVVAVVLVLPEKRLDNRSNEFICPLFIHCCNLDCTVTMFALAASCLFLSYCFYDGQQCMCV